MRTMDSMVHGGHSTMRPARDVAISALAGLVERLSLPVDDRANPAYRAARTVRLAASSVASLGVTLASLALARATVVMLVLGLAASALPAQRLDTLAAGARIRVTWPTPPRTVVGTLVRADSAELVLAPDRNGPVLAVPLATVERVYVSRGVRPKAAAFRRGAAIGFVVGATAGTIATSMALRADRRSTCDCMIPATPVVGALGIAFTGVTTLLGGAMGVAGRERWHRAWPPR